jgi:hypothetical protein
MVDNHSDPALLDPADVSAWLDATSSPAVEASAPIGAPRTAHR